MNMARAFGRALLALAAAGVAAWVQLVPLALPGVADRAPLTFRGGDGREHVYLGNFDSYLFVRHARRLLRTGTACDAWVHGECRDTLGNAPVGRTSRYHGGLHVLVIATLHALVSWLVPGFPITSSAALVPVLTAALTALVGYAIGLRLAGPLGGLAAAVVITATPAFLTRTTGADNDVWNVLLPLALVWVATEALAARDARRASLWMVAAGAVVGLHAATWSGWTLAYGVVLFAVLARVLVLAARVLLAKVPAARREALDEVVRAGIALAVFWLAAGAAVAGAGAEQRYVTAPVDLVRPLVDAITPTTGGDDRTAAGGDPTDLWPDNLASVGEMQPIGATRVIRELGGTAYVVVAGVGALLCLVLGLRSTRDEPAAGGALIAAVWLLAVAPFVFDAARHVVLLVPAVGLCVGAALGRLHGLLVGVVERFAPRLRRIAGALAFAALAAALWPEISAGHAAIARVRPAMNDAWWDALEAIRDRTPEDAIVVTWWDWGHFTTFVAERRVLADGASQRTHVPHWIARALLASSEAETLGILRMLACGSDAAGEREEAEGAIGKLRAAGLTAVEAHEVVIALAVLSRDDADARLRDRGLDAARTADVLASTHCTPPPSYLITTSKLRLLSFWAARGTWDLRRAYAARRARDLPEDDAVAEMQERLGLSAGEARGLWQEARAVDVAKLEDFVAPPLRSLTGARCRDVRGAWRCRTRVPLDGDMRIDAVDVVPSVPARTRVAVRRPPEDATEIAMPGTVVIADGTTLRKVALVPVADMTRLGDVGVLIDVPGRRVLVGPPAALSSTIADLLYLEGRYARRFTKFDERTWPGGERVVTWQIDWRS
jgi:dolichyl-phosphooligosaccharide-protein glycotransferase